MTAANQSNLAAADPDSDPLDSLYRALDGVGVDAAANDEGRFLAQLADLDRGLAAADGAMAADLRPALETALVLAAPAEDWRQPIAPPPADRLAGAGEPLGPVNGWIFTVTMILLMLLGGAGAIVVFRERVAQIALQLGVLR